MKEYQDFVKIIMTLKGDEAVSKTLSDIWYEIYKIKVKLEALEDKDAASE